MADDDDDAKERRRGDRAMRRRYDDMAGQRVDAMRSLARRDAALALLEENGSVSNEDVDRRLDATFREPDQVTLANLLAQKAAAAVEHTKRELDAERAGLERIEGKRAALQGHVDATEQAQGEARDRVSAMETMLEEARTFARFAGARGDADAAPTGSGVNVDAQTAESQAQGG